MRLAPGGPFQSERDIPPAARAALAREVRARPAAGASSTLAFLGNAARLDFGPSYKFPAREVRDIILEGFPVSAELGGWALLVALLAGIPLGVLAAVRQNTADRRRGHGRRRWSACRSPTSCSGRCWCWSSRSACTGCRPRCGRARPSRVLPVLTLAAVYVAYIARLTRAGMLDVLRQDFIRTARAKGLPERAGRAQARAAAGAAAGGLLPRAGRGGDRDGLDRGRADLRRARAGPLPGAAARSTATTRW